MGHDEHAREGAQVGGDGVLPVGHHAEHHVGQALGVGEDPRRQVPVAVVVDGVALVVA